MLPAVFLAVFRLLVLGDDVVVVVAFSFAAAVGRAWVCGRGLPGWLAIGGETEELMGT